MSLFRFFSLSFRGCFNVHKCLGCINLKAALELTISDISSWIMFSCSHVPLFRSFLLSFRGRFDVIKERTLPISRLIGNWPFLLDHLRYCFLAHRYLFQIFPLFLRKRFDVIKCNTWAISSINSKKPVQPFIFLFLLLSISVHLRTFKSSFA